MVVVMSCGHRCYFQIKGQGQSIWNADAGSLGAVAGAGQQRIFHSP
jgi:hypothetical protein